MPGPSIYLFTLDPFLLHLATCTQDCLVVPDTLLGFMAILPSESTIVALSPSFAPPAHIVTAASVLVWHVTVYLRSISHSLYSRSQNSMFAIKPQSNLPYPEHLAVNKRSSLVIAKAERVVV